MAGGATTGPPNPAGPATIGTVVTRVRTLFNIIQGVDAAPTPQVSAAVQEVLRDEQSFVELWGSVEQREIPALNQQLRAANLPAVETKK